ncbi:SWPV2-ORF110 [Shearwaterpox virus]|uniref:Protein OPG079 n=1 Tax=Shearwaterpox virus TaxID=1974596 RepID=A0A1V0QG71_CNPV|nr:SWPV2-ORF110 [Shearwaterpox virus]
MKEKITMSKKIAKPVQRRRVNEDENKSTCMQAVEHAKSLSTNNKKIVQSVKLTQSLFQGSNNISVMLEQEYKNKLVTPFVIVEGEGKVYQNKNDTFNRDEPYFLKIRPRKMNPILYQIMECIYRDLNYLDPDNTIDEKTFKDQYLYINGNRIMSGNIEYLKNGKPIGKRKSISDEIEILTKKDPQMVKAILVPSTFFDNGNICKISFSLKSIIMEKICKTTLIDTNGEVISIVTSGETDTEDDSDTETDADKECKKIQQIKLDDKKHNNKVNECDDEDCEEEQSLFSLP